MWSGYKDSYLTMDFRNPNSRLINDLFVLDKEAIILYGRSAIGVKR